MWRFFKYQGKDHFRVTDHPNRAVLPARSRSRSLPPIFLVWCNGAIFFAQPSPSWQSDTAQWPLVGFLLTKKKKGKYGRFLCTRCFRCQIWTVLGWMAARSWRIFFCLVKRLHVQYRVWQHLAFRTVTVTTPEGSNWVETYFLMVLATHSEGACWMEAMWKQ